MNRGPQGPPGPGMASPGDDLTGRPRLTGRSEVRGLLVAPCRRVLRHSLTPFPDFADWCRERPETRIETIKNPGRGGRAEALPSAAASAGG